MSNDEPLVQNFLSIVQAARTANRTDRCLIPPHPALRERLLSRMRDMESLDFIGPFLKMGEPQRTGFNDGVIIPPNEFPLGSSVRSIRSAAAERAPLRGTVRVIVVLVDFSDRQMAAPQQHFRDLFFSTGVVATGSVREYYNEVTHGLVTIDGDVVGPYRMPKKLSEYANGHSGIGGATPNATTMARDALLAADPHVNFGPYDNDGDGYVDAFVVVHAGGGAEETGSNDDIWSHKWVLDGGARTVDGTKVYGYLTVPEDARLGVCAHELGHLLFGFPDLYDTDNSSEGIGNWCLMAGGSWGGATPGDTPVHASAYCKANQGWASVDVRTNNASVSLGDVKDTQTVYRLWKAGTSGQEYFLVENRQKNRFDGFLPGGGLLIWHVDESIAGNTDENHPRVALMQADGRRDMELNHNRGDAGDPFPGATNNTSFTGTSTPNSKSYAGQSTCVAVTGISASGPVMTASLQVNCVTKSLKEAHKEIKEFKEKELRYEKTRFADKRPEKPIIDKLSAYDKGFTEKFVDKLSEGWRWMTPAASGGTSIEERIANLEAAVFHGGGPMDPPPGGGEAAATPFISGDLRPDLSRGALQSEPDVADAHEQMRMGSAQAKRQYDTKAREG